MIQESDGFVSILTASIDILGGFQALSFKNCNVAVINLINPSVLHYFPLTLNYNTLAQILRHLTT